MPYLITPSDPLKATTTVYDQTINVTTCSLSLIGRLAPSYGQAVANDLYHLLENFAGPTAPGTAQTASSVVPVFLQAPAISGQLWYDDGHQVLNLYDTSLGWSAMATENWTKTWTIQQAYVTASALAALSYLTGTNMPAGTYTKVSVNSNGLVTSGAALTQADLPSGVATPGTYPKVVVNTNGLVTSGTTLTLADLPNSGVGAGVYTKVAVNINGLVTSGGSLALSDFPSSGVSAGTYTKVAVNGNGIITWGGTLSLSDLPGSGVAAGQYSLITVNSSGIVTSGGQVSLSGLLGTATVPGTYTKVTVNNSGLVTSGGSLSMADLPSGIVAAGQYSLVTVNNSGLVTAGSQLTVGNLPYVPVGSVNGATPNGSGALTLSIAIPTNVAPGTYTKVAVNNSGLVTAGATLTVSDLPYPPIKTINGFGPDGNGNVNISTSTVINVSGTYSSGIYFINTSAGPITVTLSATLAGSYTFIDDSASWSTNNLTINGNGNQIGTPGNTAATFTANVSDYQFSVAAYSSYWRLV